MRNFEFSLTLAGGFAEPAPADPAESGVAALRELAHHPGRRDAQIDPFDCGLVECLEAGPSSRGS